MCGKNIALHGGFVKKFYEKIIQRAAAVGFEKISNFEVAEKKP